jgi:uncharacterized Zn finger protein
MAYYYEWRPYVSAAERRHNAARHVAKLKKKGRAVAPVVIEGRTIAHTFWGKAWCDNLERYSDYANRMPRGRSYVRNGSVVDLLIAPGKVTALVSGTEMYEIDISIKSLDRARWKAIIKECTGQIGSLVELLQGRFSQSVMEVLARKDRGLFPAPKEISLDCSCPDWAGMCKHLAAVLYGVGARLDAQPEIFFTLRQVDQTELITKAGAEALAGKAAKKGKKVIERTKLSSIFGIDLDEGDKAPRARTAAPRRAIRRRRSR